MKLDVYIGYDAREEIAFDVCKYSLERRTKSDVRVHKLDHRDCREQGLFWRPWHIHPTEGYSFDGIDLKPFSTDFAFTRFLVPILNKREGWALFMDCDMIWLNDIGNLMGQLDDKYAVMCVKHDHKPAHGVKMDNQQQSRYHRKNWSSFVAFNCEHPANDRLTAEVVNSQTGSWLHGFSWLLDHQIGALPTSYNWIEGVSPAIGGRPDVVHYTEGGPWFEGYEDVAYADEWVHERNMFYKEIGCL